jgi:hypothetical protein
LVSYGGAVADTVRDIMEGIAKGVGSTQRKSPRFGRFHVEANSGWEDI